MMLHELPFVMLALMLIVTGREIFYDMEVAFAAIYGFGYATWTMFAIPKYHKRLKERFSYGENIDLGWLQHNHDIVFHHSVIVDPGLHSDKYCGGECVYARFARDLDVYLLFHLPA